jgi:curved DNA-binding protein CbpA
VRRDGAESQRLPLDLRLLVPRLNPACDVASLSLGPLESFVLSHVNGRATAADIGEVTGVGDDVVKALVALSAAGAVVGVPEGAADPQPKASAPLSVGGQPAAEPISVDLEPERRQRIDELFASLEDLTHYELLGVAPTADKKQIKSAYYQVAPDFHPDKFFRKNLGPYKAKMEAIFGRITAAEAVLSRAQTRAEYDAYLEQRRRTSTIEALLRGELEPRVVPAPPQSGAVSAVRPARPPASSGSIPAAGPASSSSMRAAPSPSPAPVAASPPPSSPVIRVPPSNAQPAQVSVRSAEADRVRRQALAAKLNSGKFPVAAKARPEPDAPPPITSEVAQAAAAERLKHMYVAKRVEVDLHRFERHVEAAEEAIASGDAVNAMNHYRLALAMRPEDPELVVKSNEWTKKAAVVLAQGYLDQGDYEAREERWKDAAHSYTKAVAGFAHNATVLDKAASAILLSRGDLHKAADFALRAVSAAPTVVTYRLTLAEVYVAANLPLNARRELEAAEKLDQGNEKVRALLKRLG